ncbi:MAG TPA: Uma2 family endonuclease [Terriglobia bacterium]|nr:Uma2 family endonuclease [Terriglobia bacterium]
MATKALLTIADYTALEEPAGVRYELNEGELIVTPSASFFHNRLCDRFISLLDAHVTSHKLGDVTSETDVKLAEDVVRRPDVAFYRVGRLEGVDLDQVPLPVAPDLVIEIVSRNDRAADLLLKVSQYLAAGVQAVWLLYPITRLAYRYTAGRLEPEVRSTQDDGRFEEPELLPGFSLALADIFQSAS